MTGCVRADVSEFSAFSSPRLALPRPPICPARRPLAGGFRDLNNTVPDGAHHGRVPPAAIDPTRGLAANSASLLLGGYCSCELPHRSPIAAPSPRRRPPCPPTALHRGDRPSLCCGGCPEIWRRSGMTGMTEQRVTGFGIHLASPSQLPWRLRGAPRQGSLDGCGGGVVTDLPCVLCLVDVCCVGG